MFHYVGAIFNVLNELFHHGIIRRVVADFFKYSRRVPKELNRLRFRILAIEFDAVSETTVLILIKRQRFGELIRAPIFKMEPPPCDIQMPRV